MSWKRAEGINFHLAIQIEGDAHKNNLPISGL